MNSSKDYMPIFGMLKKYSVIALWLVVSGCTTVPDDLGRSDVDALLMERGRLEQASSVDTESISIDELLQKPLTANTAVALALLNNPDLKIAYARLGYAAADLYTAGRVSNPVFSAAFLDSNQSGERDQITYSLATSLIDLLTLPSRSKIGEAEFSINKQLISHEILNIAAQTELIFHQTQGALHAEMVHAQKANVARLTSELAARYYAAGNITERELNTYTAAATQVQIAWLHQQAELKSQQTQLAGMLGIPNDGRWQIAVDIKLPSEPEMEDVQSFINAALETRMDYLAANARIDVLAGRLGIANWQRWLLDLEAGYERERETDGAKLRGPTVAVDVPLFNQNRDSVLRARTELQIAATSLEKMRNKIANEIFLHIAVLENSRKRINEYEQQLIPSRRAVVARLQEEVNFMLTGIFDLLAAKQDEYSAYQEYLAAIRDYWSAHTRLSQAVGRDLNMGNDFPEERLKIHDLLETVSPMDHALHGGGKQIPEHIPGNSSDHSGHQHGGVQ